MVAINYQRTLFHLLGGLFAVSIALVFPYPEIIVISATFFGIAVIIELVRQRSPEFRDEFYRRYRVLMKITEDQTLLGFTWIVTAALLLTFLEDSRPMVLGLLTWTFADPMAMIAGKLLPHTHSIARGKTVEGSVAFFLTATLVASIFLLNAQAIAVPVIIVAPVIGMTATATELLSRVIRIDDNFSIPLIVGLVTYFFVI